MVESALCDGVTLFKRWCSPTYGYHDGVVEGQVVHFIPALLLLQEIDGWGRGETPTDQHKPQQMLNIA